MADAQPGELLGTIARLQVQRAPLKQRGPAGRVYDPRHLVEVGAIHLDTRGAVGLRDDGPDVVDVHNLDHPSSRDARGDRGVSLMSDAEYRWLRARYGEHLTDGIAGETVTLSGGPSLRGRDLGAGVLIGTADGWLALTRVRPATPCVEFTRHVLRRPAGGAVDDTVRATLEVLDHGMRGFVAGAAGDAVVSVGDRVFLVA